MEKYWKEQIVVLGLYRPSGYLEAMPMEL